MPVDEQPPTASVEAGSKHKNVTFYDVLYRFYEAEYHQQKLDEAGYLNSKIFLGLWLDAKGLLDVRCRKFWQFCSMVGLESQQHRQFVERYTIQFNSLRLKIKNQLDS
ncbi:MAG: hypothetical protein F6K48_15720 [Okeania sp. SIO3H1]|nr:hypothetical protein [Okeania sp. SIO3H1]